MDKKIMKPLICLSALLLCMPMSYAAKSSSKSKSGESKLCTIGEFLYAVSNKDDTYAPAIYFWGNKKKQSISNTIQALAKGGSSKPKIKKIVTNKSSISLKCKGAKKPYSFTCRTFPGSEFMVCKKIVPKRGS